MGLTVASGANAPSAVPTREPDVFRATTPAPTAIPSPRPPTEDGPELFVDELSPDAVELAATGDVNLGGRVGDLMREHGFAYPWTRVRPHLRAADLAVVNLECAISDRGTPKDKEFTFRGDPASLAAMTDAGVDVASVANNHAVDFGRDALRDTVGHLRRAGIEPVGGGADVSAAWEPVVVERRGVRFGFVGATRVMPYGFAAGADLPGVASAYEEARLVEAVGALDSRVDVLVVLIHWGEELATEPNGVQRGLARALVGAGADVIIGHHPHVLQPVERLDGAIVAFSLGNFVFTSPAARANETMILRVGVLPDGGLEAAAVPVRIRGGRPEPVG